MKSHKPLLLALTVYLFVLTFAQAQDPHVRSEYMPDIKMTKVETDMLFVSNTAEQFMQVGFLSRYPKQQLVTPKNITVTISTFWFFTSLSVSTRSRHRAPRHDSIAQLS